MFASYRIGSVWGIPIKVHLTLLLLLPLISVQIAAVMGVQSMLWGLVAAVGLFASVALHEMGHAVVALAKGIRVREILLLPIGGLAQLERMPRRSIDEIHIAIAGPIVSLALALFCAAWVILFGHGEPGLIIYTFVVLGWMNFVLAVFNLLPSFPMDGGRIFRAWLTPRLGRVAATRIAAKVGRFMAIVLGLWGVLPPFSILTIAVAVFVYMAAGAEYRMVVMQERMRDPFGGLFSGSTRQEPEREEEDTIIVSPPPYARQDTNAKNWWAAWQQKQRELFDRLFSDWGNRN